MSSAGNKGNSNGTSSSKGMGAGGMEKPLKWKTIWKMRLDVSISSSSLYGYYCNISRNTLVQTDNTMIIFYTGRYKITSNAEVGKQALELDGCLPTKPTQSGSRCTVLQQAYRQGPGNPEEGG